MLFDPSVPDLRERVRANAEAVRKVVHMRGALNARLIGSVARGDFTADSDIDVLVDSGPKLGLLGIAQLEEDLEKLLGVSVDVVVSNQIPITCRPAILGEAVPI
jgi:predicted nucleotidyltransferase